MLNPLSLARRIAVAVAFPFTLKRDFYRQLLGHHRVIGTENGLPVYSLLLPSFGGGAYRNSALKLILGAMRSLPVPSLVSIGVTDICTCACPECYFARHRMDAELLSPAEIARCVDESILLGCCVLILVGGEPLLRKEIVEILRSIDTAGITPLMFTNGEFLEERASSLSAAGLKRVMVNIHSSDSHVHDSIARRDGLFLKAMAGLRAAKKAGMLTGISVVLPHDRMEKEIDAIIGLGRRLKINELMLNAPIDASAHCGDNLYSDAIFARISALNKAKKVPFGILYYPHFAGYRGYGCAAGATRMYISPYGCVTPCDCITTSFGNVREEPLRVIWRRMSTHFGSVSLTGCRGMGRDSNGGDAASHG